MTIGAVGGYEKTRKQLCKLLLHIQSETQHIPDFQEDTRQYELETILDDNTKQVIFRQYMGSRQQYELTIEQTSTHTGYLWKKQENINTKITVQTKHYHGLLEKADDSQLAQIRNDIINSPTIIQELYRQATNKTSLEQETA